MQLILDQWMKPFLDISRWEHFDLSCKNRDATDDKVLDDAVASGARLAAIFKEPTVTPTKEQMLSLGLKRAYGSPNGAMRRGWNGVSISRDTIHLEGIKLGFSNPVLFDRHAVGGEYGAGWKGVGKGKLMTTFFPEDDATPPTIVDARKLSDDKNVAVVYHNPLDNVPELGHHFFSRCLAANVVPYVVTKKNSLQMARKLLANAKGCFRQRLQGSI
jgi:isocitrate dehydrogenase